LYFSQWLVIDRGNFGFFWFNIALTISSALFLLVGPVLGSIADKNRLINFFLKNGPFGKF